MRHLTYRQPDRKALTQVFRVLQARLGGGLYIAATRDGADIAALVGDGAPEVLTAGGFDFWFSPAWHHPINGAATQILHALSGFSARTVPLLCGDVVVCRRDAHGAPTGINASQLDRLTAAVSPARHHRVVSRRCARETRWRKRRMWAWMETAAVERLYGPGSAS